ncbi:MAG: PEP-utilizing enzyme, partial [Candidatus Woesearchaeota archaeon]|nr:PEP-utilizing enzyme [Candidatus Woesearchaeota archaeon]
MYNKIIEDIKQKLPEPKDKNMIKALNGDFYGLNLDKESKNLAESLNKIGKRRFDMHKEWARAFNDSQVLFEDIGRRIKLSLLQVENMTKKELIDALKGKNPNKKDIDDRIKSYRFNYHDGFFSIDCNVKKTIKKNSGEIKGTIAFPGLVRGKVTLLTESLKGTDIKAMTAMPKGNILVTVMTSPDMMLAIEKAAAIVTDEGGMLCHAAIVSREFKIPCIVGTRNATKVLKEG